VTALAPESIDRQQIPREGSAPPGTPQEQGEDRDPVDGIQHVLPRRAQASHVDDPVFGRVPLRAAVGEGAWDFVPAVQRDGLANIGEDGLARVLAQVVQRHLDGESV
jgi:hypothetical protein